jgi:uncharacterized protein (UPF0333 family)
VVVMCSTGASSTLMIIAILQRIQCLLTNTICRRGNLFFGESSNIMYYVYLIPNDREYYANAAL